DTNGAGGTGEPDAAPDGLAWRRAPCRRPYDRIRDCHLPPGAAVAAPRAAVVLGSHGDRAHGGDGHAKRRTVGEISLAHDDRRRRERGKKLIVMEELA